MRVNVHFNGFTRADMDRRGMKKAMRSAGAIVSRGAKRLVARKGIGLDGYPARITGKLQRSIFYRVSSVGLMVKIEHFKWQGGDFYPAFLTYGVTGHARRRDHSFQVKNGRWRIAPRNNYFVAALAQHQRQINDRLQEGLRDAVRFY